MFASPLVSALSSRRLLVASGIVIILSLLSLLVATAVDRRATAATLFSSSEPVVRDLPTPELPREWRWKKPGVEYEHMFMTPRRVDREHKLRFSE